MKKYFLQSILLASILAFAFVSCSDDDDNNLSDQKLELDKAGAFVLNEGDMKENNAKLTHYDIAQNKVTANILEVQNDGVKLGNTAQDILIYDSKVFITVLGSDKIFVTDLDGVILKEISTKDAPYKEPRYMAEHGGYIYISFYKSHLVKLDPETYEIKEALEIPEYSEEMTVANSELYITNSMRQGLTEGTTVTVVNLNTFKIEREPITVHINPNRILSDSKGNVYVSSQGDYNGIGSALSIIKANSYKAEVIGENISTIMAIQGNRILLSSTQYDENWNSVVVFSQYDMTTGKHSEESFLTVPSDDKVAKYLQQTYHMSVDPTNQDIYISATDYKTTGTVLIFDKDGKYKSSFSSGGVNPQKVAFMKK